MKKFIANTIAYIMIFVGAVLIAPPIIGLIPFMIYCIIIDGGGTLFKRFGIIEDINQRIHKVMEC